jgi:hypothetical protein
MYDVVEYPVYQYDGNSISVAYTVPMLACDAADPDVAKMLVMEEVERRQNEETIKIIKGWFS